MEFVIIKQAMYETVEIRNTVYMDAVRDINSVQQERLWEKLPTF